jgi:hypothetical protein
MSVGCTSHLQPKAGTEVGWSRVPSSPVFPEPGTIPLLLGTPNIILFP